MSTEGEKPKKKNLFFKERIYPIFFMAIITVVFISVVSWFYLSTEDLVVLNETLFLKRAVLYAAGIEAPEDGYELEELYQSRVRESEGSELPWYRILDEQGQPQGLVLFTIGAGLWGEINAVLGFDPAGQTMTGLEFTRQNETPGLGARITEDWFKEQFRGKKGPFIMVPEGTAAAANELDAITGATRTSQAVLSIINNAVKTAAATAKEVN